MKEFKYTIDGKEYKVQIDAVEGNIASVNVNGEAYKVEMEQEAEPEKKKVVLGQPAASDDAEATPAANVNTANAVKAPLPGTITSIEVAVGQEVKAGDTVKRGQIIGYMSDIGTKNNVHLHYEIRKNGVYAGGNNDIPIENPLKHMPSTYYVEK